MNDKKRIDTKLVTGGRRKEWAGKLVNVPVSRGSTVLFDTVAELRDSKPGFARHYYGLHGWPTQWSLAEALTEIEPGATGTALVETGLAAVTVALMSALSAGDELLMVDSAYEPTRKFCDGQLKRFGIGTRLRSTRRPGNRGDGP
jgi:cysteine-S-conjugate beta-lyase